jgi:hypothetical protein
LSGESETGQNSWKILGLNIHRQLEDEHLAIARAPSSARSCSLDARGTHAMASRRRIPTTYLTVAELKQIAADRFEEAAALPPGPKRQDVLEKAYGFQSLADIKSWLSSELRPPR